MLNNAKDAAVASMEKEGDGLSTKEYTTTLSLIIAFRVLATVGVVTHLGLRKCRRIRLALDDWLLLLTSVRIKQLLYDIAVDSFAVAFLGSSCH